MSHRKSRKVCRISRNNLRRTIILIWRDYLQEKTEYIPKSSSLKYSRVRELAEEAFAEFIDPKIIGVHSLRAGGASVAANAGISDRLFKRHGRNLILKTISKSD